MAHITMGDSITTKHIAKTDSIGQKICIIAEDFQTMFFKVREWSNPEPTRSKAISIMVQEPKEYFNGRMIGTVTAITESLIIITSSMAKVKSARCRYLEVA